MKNEQLTLKLRYILIMSAFGVIGPIIRAIGLPSPVVASLRGWISGIIVTLYLLITKHDIDRGAMKKALLPMLLSGFFMAVSWVGLFEAYNYTTIAAATVGFYLAPVLVFLCSPLLLGEKLTMKHFICALVAFAGMVFISGVMDEGAAAGDLAQNTKGILFAILGAVTYAGSILINKKYPAGEPMARTAVQLLSAALFSTPYALLRYDISALHFTPQGIAMLLLLSVVFTAFVYIRYFDIILKIPARTVAIFSYMDPLVAVFVSVAVMGEQITMWGILGTIMIIGAALASELK